MWCAFSIVLIVYMAYNIAIPSSVHLGFQYVITNIDKYIITLIWGEFSFVTNCRFVAKVLVPLKWRILFTGMTTQVKRIVFYSACLNIFTPVVQIGKHVLVSQFSQVSVHFYNLIIQIHKQVLWNEIIYSIQISFFSHKFK